LRDAGEILTSIATQRGYYPFIDGLRAIAVLGVILFHCSFAHVTGGYVGVDVFFLISGFLIGGQIDSQLQKGFSFAQFYERRCRRIIPPLLVTCALCTIAAAILLVPEDFREFGKTLKGVALFYSNVVFENSEDYFARPATTMPLLHTWSLAVEEQFYLFFPPLLWAIHRLASRRRALIAVAVGLVCLASLLLSLLLVRVDVASAFYLLPARAWELLCGALVAIALPRTSLPRISREAASALGLLGIAASYFLFDRDTVFPGAAALLPCLSAALVIWANIAAPTFVGRALSSRPLIGVGLISYGLYLYHWPFLAFSRYFLDHDLTALETIVALSLAVVLALLSYRLIEMPIRTGAVLPRRQNVLRFSAIGLAVFAVIGLIGVNSDGLPMRFSGAALQYASGAHDTWDWGRCMLPLDRLTVDNLCRVGAGKSPTFLLWGDSHAAAIEPGMDAEAKAHGISGWYVGYSRCPALLGAEPALRHSEDHPCAQIAERVIALVRDNPGVKTVVLASRWDAYVSGREPGSSETRQDLTIALDTPAGHLAGEQAFQEALQQTVKRFQALGVNVWIIEQVPPQLVDVPSALAKAVYFGRDPAALQRPFEDIERRRSAASVSFARYQRWPHVFILDPVPLFCPDRKPCRIEVDGHSLYVDNNHLSKYGALWSQSVLSPIFEELRASKSAPPTAMNP
jgi:peptidoglycan/LPS O-acetylase OafA/YrhL